MLVDNRFEQNFLVVSWNKFKYEEVRNIKKIQAVSASKRSVAENKTQNLRK